MTAAFGDDPGASGGKTRQFYLHCFIGLIEIFFNVGRKLSPQLLGIARDYNQRPIPERPGCSDLLRVFTEVSRFLVPFTKRAHPALDRTGRGSKLRWELSTPSH